MQDAIARLARDVERLAEGVLAALPLSEIALARLMDLVQARIGAARVPAQPPACAPGCAACCTVNVGTLALEGAAIAALLRSRLGDAGSKAKGVALLDFHERVRWLDDGERIRAGLACPFLDGDGACSIHAARPLACRSISSLDPEDCRRAVEERGEGEDRGLVSMDLLQHALSVEALGALKAAVERRGLDGRLRDVTGMAGAFLADPTLARAYGEGSRLPLE